MGVLKRFKLLKCNLAGGKKGKLFCNFFYCKCACLCAVDCSALRDLCFIVFVCLHKTVGMKSLAVEPRKIGSNGCCNFSDASYNFSGARNNFSATSFNFSGARNNLSDDSYNFSDTRNNFSDVSCNFSEARNNFSDESYNFSFGHSIKQGIHSFFLV